MIFSEQTKTEAEKLGIQLACYDVEGHFIGACPASVDYFIQLFDPPKDSSEPRPLFNEVCIFEQDALDETVLTQRLIELFPELSSQPFSFSLFDERQALIFPVATKAPFPRLAIGYYTLEVNSNAHQRVRVMVAPKTAFRLDQLPQQQKNAKYWGLTVQLYSLRSERNWGIGDFADLSFLAEKSAPFGVDFIGINPLHEGYPDVRERSPYSASSRRWLNTIYLAVDKLVEFAHCQSVQQWFTSECVQGELAQLRAIDKVDYAAVFALKNHALRELFAYFKRSKAAKIVARREAFAKFKSAQGESLALQSLFDVLDYYFSQTGKLDTSKVGYLGWADYQQLTTKQQNNLLVEYAEDVDYFSWLQWLAHEQLVDVKATCQSAGMDFGIYGDLAVSCSMGGADVWTDPSLFCRNATVGAPPDPLGPVGQNWEIPPYNPTELKARGYQPFIDLLRSNMRYFGILRIDHIMGLYRLWLIPRGESAAQGVYVKYPFDVLMAILAIESQRQQCVIVGEDLGIVPPVVREKLAALQIFSYFVLYFEQQGEVFPFSQNIPTQAFATIGTHDVPSLQSFWHCRDLELYDALDILKGESLGQKYDERVRAKQAILNTLHRDGYLSDDYQGDALTMAMHDNLNKVIHEYIAQSNSALVGIQLENLLRQEVSFNLPGTWLEYPNWQLKLSQTLEQIFANEQVCHLLNQINHIRKP